VIRRLDNPARERMEKGDVALGVGIVQGRTVDIAVLMKTAGYDWLFLDLEHGAMAIDTCAQIAVAANHVGIAPIVRVPIGGYGLATRLLDTGAMGITMPHVETAGEARELVDNCRFPPVGHRGIGGGVPQFNYEAINLGEAVEELNRSMLLIAMVETPQAIERADEIAAVEGIDVVMIGTNDLALAMGVPQQFAHPRVVAAYETVAAACSKHGKWLGSGGVREPEHAQKYVAMGARFFLAGQDIGFMIAGGTARARILREAVAKA
jgi:2-keto-3-deoxy-L-rhamnonate aldolase RhmA